MEIDDIAVYAEDIKNPVGNKYTHYAKVQHLYVMDNSVRRKIDHDFGECPGETKDDAENKMRAKVKEWVESQ